jgi:hypothetical protein
MVKRNLTCSFPVYAPWIARRSSFLQRRTNGVSKGRKITSKTTTSGRKEQRRVRKHVYRAAQGQKRKEKGKRTKRKSDDKSSQR